MKKLHILTTALLALTALTACNDDKMDLFPEEYRKVLAFKNAGTHDVPMNTTIEKLEYQLLILRGGGDPHSESNLEIRIMDKAEACATWNYKEEDIEIIPASSYEIPGGTTVSLSADESHKYVTVNLFPALIHEAKMTAASDAMWILPIVLSSRTDNVNPNLNKILLRCDVSVPEVMWDEFDGDSKDVEITWKEVSFPLTLKVAHAEYNTAEIVATLDAAENAALVAEYNRVHGKNYELLPASAYSFEGVTIGAGEISSTEDLILKRQGIVSDRTYLLPLKFRLSTNLVAKDDEVKYLIVTNPKYAFADVDRSNWRVVFTNQESGYVWGSAANLIDGNSGSLWISCYPDWEGLQPATNTYDDYVYENSALANTGRFSQRPYYYPTCQRPRLLETSYIVIDMGESLLLGAGGLEKLDANPDNRTLKNCKVAVADNFTLKPAGDYSSQEDKKKAIADYTTVSNSANGGWTDILDCEANSAAAGCYWTYISGDTEPKAGRYIRLNPYGSWHQWNPEYAAVFGEFYAKKIVSIDGEPYNPQQ